MGESLRGETLESELEGGSGRAAIYIKKTEMRGACNLYYINCS